MTVFTTTYGNCRKLFTNTSYIYVDKNRCFYTPLHLRRRNCHLLKPPISFASICLQTPPISQSKKSGIFIPPPSLVLVRKMRIIRLNGSIASICLQLPPHIPVKEKRHFYTPLHKIRVHMQKNPEIKRVVQISRHNLCCI